MAYSDNFPATRPVFQADFANGGRIDPRASFSRASTANVWDGSKHLSSQNLVLNSEALSGWDRAQVTPTANAGTAPDGSTTADSFIVNTTGIYSWIWDDTAGAVDHTGDIVFSVYAKMDGWRWIQLFFNNSSEAVWFDLQNGVLGAEGSGSTGTITAIGSTGWYRCSIHRSGTNRIKGSIGMVDDNSQTNGTAHPTNAALFWGAQLTTGFSGPTAYNATTTQIHREYAPSLKSVATAGQPRFEYDPSADGQSEGILIESQSTNLVTYSSDITQSFFTGFRSTQESNVAVAPDGTLTADLLREDSSSGNSHGVYFEYASGGTTAQTISVYAKAVGRNHLSFRFDTTNGVFGSDFVYFNLSTGAVGTTDSDITASIESCGNGWYRCIATRTALASANGRIVLYLADADNSTSYDGDSYSGVLLWGIQAEANASHASSLISTSGATATRAAESLSMTDSSLFDNGGGALFVEASSSDKAAAYSGIASLNDGSSNNRVEVYNYYTYVRGDVSADGATQSSQYGGAFSSDVAYKACLTYDSNNVSLYANGSEIGATDTAATMPTVDRITLGNTNSGTNYLNGHIKRVALYSEPISETAAAALTS